MKKFTENKWYSVIYGGLLTLVGVLTLIFAITDITKVDAAISIGLAVSLFIIGIIHIATSLIAHTNDFFSASLLMGSIAIAFGVVLCINRALIGEFITYLLGTFFLALALVALIKFILFIVYKQKLMWIVGYGVVTLVALAAGILILIFRAESKQVLYCIIGASIILSGLLEIAVALKDIHDIKKYGPEGKPADNSTSAPVEEVIVPAEEAPAEEVKETTAEEQSAE